jgi:hypothetical protein
MDDPYAEAPLNLRKQEIRLVKLEHSTDTEPIRCSLRSYAIDDDCPAYVALSYAWGPKERHDDILLNGVGFPIGRSLWSFLAQMRSQHQYMTFWIDALSINQANVQEQNHQVQMMRQIYSKAHSVWIWLGEADLGTHSDLAMQFLESQKPTVDKEFENPKFWDPKRARAVSALFERTYWTRIWIVQEVLLARKATLLCGSKQVQWTKLLHLITNLQIVADRGQAFCIIGASNILASPAAVIVRAKFNWNESSQPLSKLLELYRYQHSTDIRDKVYALHGLASDSDGIRVDYTLHPIDLFVTVIYHACLNGTQSKPELLWFAIMMCAVLEVYCEERELLFHISVARGDSVEKDYRLSRRSHHWSKDYVCFIKGCDVSFSTSSERTLHMRRHMRNAIRVLGPTEDSGQKEIGHVKAIGHCTTGGLELIDEERWRPLACNYFSYR